MKNEKGVLIAITLLFIGLGSVFFPFNILDGLSFLGFQLTIDGYNDLGEFVGGISTPFLSTSAFILLYLTYKSQKKELSESRKILKKQSLIVEKQIFDTTFFNSLELLNNIIQNITYEQEQYTGLGVYEKPIQLRGRECFRHLYNDFQKVHEKKVHEWIDENMFEAAAGEHFKVPKESSEKIILTAYNEFFDTYQGEVGHYFRTLYNIIKYVKDNNLKTPKYYTNLVRAQLSSFEHLLLFYNCKSDYGSKFYPLIIEFSLLDNMPKDKVLEEIHLQFYPEEAYK